MNYEVESILNPINTLWICAIKVWRKGSCRCTAESHVVELYSDTRPTLEEIKKALN